jgi:hypothetical protein
MSCAPSEWGCLGARKQTNWEDTDWLRARRPWIDSQQAVSPRPALRTCPFSCSASAVGDSFLRGFMNIWHFNDAFQLHLMSQGWMVKDSSKWIIGNDMKGSSCVIFQKAIPAFSWTDWGMTSIGPKIETGACRIRSSIQWDNTGGLRGWPLTN